jgi:hypothetical protein
VPVDRQLSQKTQSVYKRTRRQSDPMFKLRSNTSSLIANSLSRRGYVKSSDTIAILGCSLDQFRIHLENQFTVGMLWSNRSLWHIDHIVPISFARTESELLQLNHYSNLRPVWAKDNLSKGGKLLSESQDHPIYKLITENRLLV